MIERPLIQILKSNSEVTAMVGVKIYTDHMPSSTTYPCICLHEVAHPEIAEAYYVDTIQFSCWAETYTQAKQLSDAVKKALNRYCGVYGNYKIKYIWYLRRNRIDDREKNKTNFATDFKVKYSQK